MDERVMNMNPTVDEYAAQIDLHTRKFAVQKATEAFTADHSQNIVLLATELYKFLSAQKDV